MPKTSTPKRAIVELNDNTVANRWYSRYSSKLLAVFIENRKNKRCNAKITLTLFGPRKPYSYLSCITLLLRWPYVVNMNPNIRWDGRDVIQSVSSHNGSTMSILDIFCAVVTFVFLPLSLLSFCICLRRKSRQSRQKKVTSRSLLSFSIICNMVKIWLRQALSTVFRLFK